MKFDTTKLKWTREPADYTMEMSECKWLAHDGQQPEVCL